MSSLTLRPLAAAIALLFIHTLPAWAEGADKQLGEIVIKGGKSPVPANLPATTEGMTAQQITETVNAPTAAATLKYLPSIVVRERFVGDRNGIISTRTTGTISSATTLVYGDGLLLSNLLGNSFSYPPRWGMVTPNEIDRVDIIYGPFSALYPGNSAGGVALLSTRMPSQFEAHAGIQASQQDYKLYGSSKRYDNLNANAAIGNRIGDWSFWISGDRLDAHSHPMSFGTATYKDAAAGGTAVTGAYTDRSQTGAQRIITGGYGIDHTVQNNGKIKLAYDFSPEVRATYTLGIWQNTSDTTVESYLRNSSGATYYNTPAGQYVNIGGKRYTVASLSPGRAESEHIMHGFSLKSAGQGEWAWEANASLYDYSRDLSRTAGNTGTDSGTGSLRPAGTLTKMDGTGWQNLDLRGEYRPGGLAAARHRISFGYHYDRYELDSHTYATSDWLSGGAGAESAASRGKTQTQAVYLQDAWQFAPDWKAVIGARAETWRAFDGANFNASSTPKSASYVNRQESAISPKLALNFQASPDWLLRGSLGKATRFPTVAELFQTITSGANRLLNDPNLRPESVWSGELSAERAIGTGLLRVSLFQENKTDALYSQTDTTVTPNISSIQNIDKIRTRGVETAWQLFDVGLRGLDISGSLTYADSVILKNSRSPAIEGKKQPRIPDWRAKLMVTWRQNDKLSYTLATRYSGNQHINLDNSDINPATYGGASKYLITDARVVYRVARQWTASLGIDNLNNYKAYVSHPWPQRTLFAGLKFDY